MENPQINPLTGEFKTKRKTSFSTIKRENVSVQPVGSSKVVLYDFVSTYQAGPSGDKEDYRVIKKPKKIEEYDIEKVMVQRCKGQDLKSIISRIEKTGDVSILNQKQPVYGDGSKYPRNLGDALQKGRDGDAFLSKLSSSEREQLIKMAKDPKEFEKFVRSQAEKKINSQPKVEEKGVQQKVDEKGETK